jgi:signal transduction histidine kinase
MLVDVQQQDGALGPTRVVEPWASTDDREDMSSDRAILAAMIELASANKPDWVSTIQHILRVEARVLDVERVSFWTLGDDLGCEQAMLCEMAYHRATGVFERGSRMPVGELLVAIASSAPLAIEDVRANPQLRGARGYLDERGIASLLACPVWCAGRLTGILILEHVGPLRRWSSSDQRFAASVAQAAGAALDARACIEAQASSVRAAFLERAASTLGQTLDICEVACRAVALSVPSLADGARVDLVDGGAIRTLAFEYRTAEGRALLQAAMQEHAAPPRGGYLARSAVAQRASILVPDLTNDVFVHTALHPAQPHVIAAYRAVGMRSLIAVPLFVGERIIGVVTLYGAARPFGVDDLGLAESFAKPLAAALENAQLHQRVEDALQARDEFIALAGHELRTPLTALQLTAQELALRAPDNGVGRSARMIVKQTKRLERLAEQMLDAMQVADNRLPCSPAPTDLAGIARDVAEALAPVFEQAGCTLVMRADGPVVGQWDATQLDQMLSCLLENAVKFGAGRPVEVAVRCEGEAGTVSVSDHGPGIPPDRVPYVFEAFERAVSVKHHGGLGLGLFIARAIAQGHGGSLMVDNRPGEGVTFTARLPLHAPSGVRAEPAP